MSISRPCDPFSLKAHSRLHPRRLVFTLMSRLHDQWARLRFDRYALPCRAWAEARSHPEAATDTAVTPEQMAELLLALQHTETLGGLVVEVGSYRGVTTCALSKATGRTVVAVDPFIGWGGSDEDFRHFRQRTQELPGFRHLRATSGEAAQTITEPVSLVFIDAVHDYSNVFFDGWVWGERLMPGGLIAFHDTDQVEFAGARRAVWELARRPGFALHAHVDGLAILGKQA